MNTNVNTRNIILDALTEINENGRFTHVVMSEALGKYRYLPGNDRSFILRTTLGTVERRITIDYVLDIYSKVKTVKMKPLIRNLLRMSVYQLLYMDGTKDFAVINEAVKLASKRGFASLKGYVNGVLRTICKNKGNIEFPDNKDAELYLSVKYSVPTGLVSKLIKDYGYVQAEEIFGSQFSERPLTVCSNTDKMTACELSKRLSDRGIKVNSHVCIEGALEISDYDYLEKIEEFENGSFWVQDISSMLAVEVIPLKEGAYVMDMCAAPGGKSLYAAKKLNGGGHIDARDISVKKTGLIRENVLRTGFKNISVKAWNAEILDKEMVGKADAVIADVPCSGLGILNKKPDIKYRICDERYPELVRLQRTILKNAAEYVKPGGFLMYSTCTLNPQENLENIEWFTGNFPFETVNISGDIPGEMKCFMNEKNMLQIIPDKNAHYDGFFITLLKKVN